MSSTSPLFVANWKMNKLNADAVAFAHEASAFAKEELGERRVVLCPSFTSLHELAGMTQGTPIGIGAQDCSEHIEGPYTGQVSASMVAQAGCSHCIVGHSERRHGLGESTELVAQKTQRVLEAGLIPIVCIGESQEEYNAKQTNIVLEQQLAPIIEFMRHDDRLGTQALVIAYEPVWSIGTGIVADEEILRKTFDWLHSHVSSNSLCASCLLYGGSVSDQNASSLLALAHVHGLLIGGASLDFQTFRKIVLS